MADLDLDSFVSATFALVSGFSITGCAFGGEPGGEEGGGVEVLLEIADYLRRGYYGGLIDCYEFSMRIECQLQIVLPKTPSTSLPLELAIKLLRIIMEASINVLG